MSLIRRPASVIAAQARPPIASGHRLFGSMAVYGAANVLSSAIPLLLLPVLTRVLSPADFGLAAMFSVVFAMLVPLVGLGTKHAFMVRFFGEHGGDMSRFLTACLALTAVSSATLAVLILPFQGILTSITQLPAGSLFVAVAAAAAQFVFGIAQTVWQVRRMALRFGMLQVLQSAANVGLSLLFVVALGLGWEGRVLGQVAALVLFAMLGVIGLWSALHLDWPPRADHAREALVFGLPLVPHGLAAAATVLADRFLITALVDVEQTGLYAAALQISMVLGLAVQAFNRAYQPWLFAGLHQGDIRFGLHVVRGSYVYFVFLAATAGMIGLAAPLLVRVILGARFQGAAEFVPFIALGIAFGGMYNVVGNYLILSRRTGWLSGASLISGAINIAGGILLIRRSGTIGAAQAFMLSQAVLFLITWWLAARAYPMPWRSALARA
jgi:O-antigen/teichoic acid export membrane protein